MNYVDKHFTATTSFHGVAGGWRFDNEGHSESTMTALDDGTTYGTFIEYSVTIITQVDAQGNILLDDFGNPVNRFSISTSASGTVWGTLSEFHFSGAGNEGQTVEGYGTFAADGSQTQNFVVHTPTGDVYGTGYGAADEEFAGTLAAESYTGKAGADTLSGGGGNDTLAGGAEEDILYGGDDNDSLDGGISHDSLSGGTGNDSLVGGEGNDTLYGGTGDDYIDVTGGGDNEEDGGDGTDIIQMTGSLSDYSVYIEKAPKSNPTHLTFTGLSAGDIVVLTDKDGHVNRMVSIEKVQFSGSGTTVDVSETGLLSGVGTYANDKLTGDDSDNLMHAGAGNDVMSGGAGSDQLYGDAGNDQLNGEDGNDRLEGSAGNDKLTGGTGDDTYIIADNGKGKVDTILEKASEGTDTVISSLSYTLGKELEKLVFSGSGNYTGTGNTQDNDISGATGNDTLNGKEGNDTLLGGVGNDIFVFDTKLGSTNIDTISDFVSGEDDINLSKKIFSAFKKAGMSLSSELLSTADAGTVTQTSTNAHLLYDTSTGNLYYDADGSGANAAVQFATLTGAPTLAASDLHIV